MLTDKDILDAVNDAPLAQGPQSFVLAIGRAIEAKVLASRHAAHVQGKTCRTCTHLDSDPREEPCVGCRDFARWEGADGVATVDPPRPFDPEDNLETAIRRFGGRMVLNRTPRGRKLLKQMEAIYAEKALAYGVRVNAAPDLRAALEQCRNALLALGGISHVPMARDAVDAANRALGVPGTDGGLAR